ncbi:MAG: serine/threonine-protein phosphatase [bacterium]|nr:serine/threonine-protein phosphatase [bacterium]
MEIFTGCLTERGNYRNKNQDSAVCCRKKSREDTFVVACVCDGIGSFEQSEIASRMLTEGIVRWFHGMEELFPEQVDEEMLVLDLEMTIEELNELVYEYQENKGIEIGCTMSILLLVNTSYYVFHVGDSRIYKATDGLYQITRDEVAMVEVEGKIKSLLSNFIGKTEKLWMHKLSGMVEKNDLFLLGSDGLFKKLKFEDIREMKRGFKNDKKVQAACKECIRLVLERGEKDNISCILIYVKSLF